MLVIKNFSKSYADQLILALSEVRFTQGVYWIKGQNGSGKTTLFKALAGLHPCQGIIYFEGGPELHQQPVAYRKKVNYSEAEPYPGFLTPKDLFKFIGKAKGASAIQQQSLADVFGIAAYYEKPCETHSSGMLKKVSLALAFLGTPELIILDEPLITLDEAARTILLQLMEERVAKEGVTFLVSSHQVLENALLPVKGIYTVENKTLIPE
jgi:ABC-2 type transport system ATP-binding protein